MCRGYQWYPGFGFSRPEQQCKNLYNWRCPALLCSRQNSILILLVKWEIGYNCNHFGLLNQGWKVKKPPNKERAWTWVGSAFKWNYDG